ncbi:unnamed protein product [Prorocentrum cordatum]|uniref:Uncharacterized protein n=1 Tax=Prorocentrum cordatum TaxID=2364126 RepID=A0ABN9UBL1_9DINO|nr:unnamed protein product [Polarella glacialis]CAK0886308.1 unnamed protein product [Polarella glacialis]CAK0910350.1 unnamed protein product [Polarella glacialis]|mmetsp:Transcript_39783/g.105504  ORF Transcript_39783/g.105504 Transcript_39783/m.105504 type:complete len:374 (-) Transcript_39783:791-1912(-)
MPHVRSLASRCRRRARACQLRWVRQDCPLPLVLDGLVARDTVLHEELDTKANERDTVLHEELDTKANELLTALLHPSDSCAIVDSVVAPDTSPSRSVRVEDCVPEVRYASSMEDGTQVDCPRKLSVRTRVASVSVHGSGIVASGMESRALGWWKSRQSIAGEWLGTASVSRSLSSPSRDVQSSSYGSDDNVPAVRYTPSYDPIAENEREVYDSSSDDVDAMDDWQIGERYAAEIKDVLAHIEVSVEVLGNDVLRDKHLATQLEIDKTGEYLAIGTRGMEAHDLLDELYRLHKAKDDRWHGFISRLRDDEFLTKAERQNCVSNLLMVHDLKLEDIREHIKTGTEFEYGREKEIEELSLCMDAWKDFLMSMSGSF